MPAFQDIFGIQLLGQLRHLKSSGDLHLAIDKRKAVLSLQEGLLVAIQYPGLPPVQALQYVLWRHQGQLEYKPQATKSAQPALAIEMDPVLEAMPAMPSTCPLMPYLYLARGKLILKQDSKFSRAALEILSNMKNGCDIATAQGKLPAAQFWPSVFYLISGGEITASYDPVAGKLLRHLETQLTTQWGKFLGKHIAKNYTDKVTLARQTAWPDWNLDKEPDPLYGSAPYRTWAQAIAENSVQIGAPAIAQRCYKQVMAALAPPDAALFAALSTPT